MPDDPICPCCSKPARPHQAVMFEHGDFIHVKCESAARRLRAMELDRARRHLARTREAFNRRAERLIASRSLAGLTVLLIDDDHDSRDALQLWLESFGATVLVAGSGEQALWTLKTITPGVILSDLRLPGMNGYTLASRIRARPEWATIRLIAASGTEGPAAIEMARAAGFTEHLSKPVDPDQLVGILSRVTRLAS